MKNFGVAAVLCGVVALGMIGPAATEHNGLAVVASTTVGRLHVDLRKAAGGPLGMRLQYGERRCGERAAISVTLGSFSEAA